MRALIALTHVSIDGVMQAPGGSEEDPSGRFTEGGWTVGYRSEAGGKALGEIVARDFDLLLGRRTYDIWTGHWPHHVDNPIGAAFARATKYVVTHRDGLSWGPSQRIDGVDGVRALKATAGPELHLWGSSEVLQPLIGAGLVDEYRLWVYPVVLGAGKRLFEAGAPASGLELVESQSTPTGVVLNTYRPAGAIKRPAE